MSHEPVKLLFLFAHVGGGHRAPAEAVREALRRTVGKAARVELVGIPGSSLPSHRPEITLRPTLGIRCKAPISTGLVSFIRLLGAAEIVRLYLDGEGYRADSTRASHTDPSGMDTRRLTKEPWKP